MARFDEATIRRVQQAIDIVELIGERVSLKKSGKDLKGLCPFHADKNPSMYVSPSKQIFKCFACGAGGGVFQFIQRFEHVEFPEAVRILAGRANIELVEQNRGSAPAGPGKVVLADINKWAARKFRDWLGEPRGDSARNYLEKRGFAGETIRRFGLGYAPAGWDNLINAAQAERKDAALLAAAGLITESRRTDRPGSYYDTFRDRLMFPILDVADRVIGFGGRTLGEDTPKYLNTAETPLFNKGRELYGLRWARQGINTTETVCVVEGYTDVLMAHQGGIDNVVAALGTALTDQHVRILGRLAKKIIVIFDADAAGEKAADRALDLFLSAGVDLKVATMPEGLDPCDLILRDGPASFAAAMDSAVDALEYKWSTVSKRFGAAESTADRVTAAEAMIATLAGSAGYNALDTMRRNIMLDRLATLLKTSSYELNRMLLRQVRRQRPTGQPPAGQEDASVQAPPRSRKSTDVALAQVLGVLLNEATYFDSIRQTISAADYADPPMRALAEETFRLAQDGELSLAALLRTLESADLASLATELAERTRQLGDLGRTFEQAVGNVEHNRALESARQAAARISSREFADDDLRALARRPADFRRLRRD